MPPQKRKRSARELEIHEVTADIPGEAPVRRAPSSEVMGMLVRRGLNPETASAGIPFPEGTADAALDRISAWLGHYSFRLFFRGAIRKPEGFRPEETTRYLSKAQAKRHTDALLALGLAERIGKNRFRLKHAVASFGATLEWYVGRELERRYGFDVATGVKLHAPGGGGDLDVVAAAEGKLVYLELKSSPPRNLSPEATAAFWRRLILLRPDLALFVVDTALRLSDKIIPMLAGTLPKGSALAPAPRRTGSRIWSLTPHVYVVNGQRNLMANIGRAIAEGFRALSPPLL
jgi:hypothetical protein